MRLQIQAAKMGFLRMGAGLSLRDRVKSLAICWELKMELLLFHIERSQLRLECLLVASLWRSSGHVQLEGGPGVDQDLA